MTPLHLDERRLLADRLRWIYQQRTIDLDLAKEVCGKIDVFVHYLDELVALRRSQLGLQVKIEQARAALCEPDTSDAYYNLEGALIDIKRFIEKGEPTDEVCVRTIERVQAQIAAGCRALAQPEEI
jgi:hypothetical protein